jgi:hypothetical protein
MGCPGSPVGVVSLDSYGRGMTLSLRRVADDTPAGLAWGERGRRRKNTWTDEPEPTSASHVGNANGGAATGRVVPGAFSAPHRSAISYSSDLPTYPLKPARAPRSKTPNPSSTGLGHFGQSPHSPYAGKSKLIVRRLQKNSGISQPRRPSYSPSPASSTRLASGPLWAPFLSLCISLAVIASAIDLDGHAVGEEHPAAYI